MDEREFHALDVTVAPDYALLKSGVTAGAGMVAAVLLVAGFIVAMAMPARAELQVRSTVIEEGELELEHIGALVFSRNRATRVREQAYTNSIGYGITSWWKAELEMELASQRGEALRYEATALENTFRITPQGQYYVDLGFFAEYSKARRRDDNDSVTLGPILQKRFGSALLTLNLFFERTVRGPERTDTTAFIGAFQAVYRLAPLFAPGLEYHAGIEDLGAVGRFRDQEHRLGPVVVGNLCLGNTAKLKYELGYLLPLTHGAHGGALRWKLALELRL